MHIIHRVTESLIDDEQGGFKSGRGCVDWILTWMQIGKKACEKKQRIYLGFMDLEKVYDRINREVLWQMLRM